MENLVFSLKQISFQDNCENILTENRAPNFFTAVSATPPFWTMTTAAIPDVFTPTNLPFLSATATYTANESASKQSDYAGDSTDDDACSTSAAAARYSLRRKKPTSESSVLKTNRRSIMKPSKQANQFTIAMRPVDIKKIYLTKTLTNFRPSKLETIFEEPQPDKRKGAAARPAAPRVSDASDSDTGGSLVRFIGLKKLRRSLSCSDGLNVNKSLLKQRRAKIKRTFGRRSVLKKIALEDFLQRLTNSIGADEGEEKAATGSAAAAAVAAAMDLADN